MKTVTIEITQWCEHMCSYCSSCATMDGRHLPFDKIVEWLECQHGIQHINISGGEPLAHPEFYRILRHCEKIAPVTVYTNALRRIRFNADILPGISISANVILIPGEPITIPDNTPEVHLLRPVRQGRYDGRDDVDFLLSGGNCGDCDHKVLQADGYIALAPCQKCYDKSRTDG